MVPKVSTLSTMKCERFEIYYKTEFQRFVFDKLK